MIDPNKSKKLINFVNILIKLDCNKYLEFKFKVYLKLILYII